MENTIIRVNDKEKEQLQTSNDLTARKTTRENCNEISSQDRKNTIKKELNDLLLKQKLISTKIQNETYRIDEYEELLKKQKTIEDKRRKLTKEFKQLLNEKIVIPKDEDEPIKHKAAAPKRKRNIQCKSINYNNNIKNLEMKVNMLIIQRKV